MTKVDSIFNGKEKKIFSVAQEQSKVIIHFKDVVTAYGNIKRARYKGKGELCCCISSILLHLLGESGIRTHFLRQLSPNEQLCRRISLIPLEFTVRNVAAGTMAERLGLEEGRSLLVPVLDLSYNCDELGDPFIVEDEAVALGIVTRDEITKMRAVAMQVNGILQNVFKGIGITLVDFKMEFGRDDEGGIIVSDEISPDTCRLWEDGTQKCLDKDLFRHDGGSILEAYAEVCRRLEEKYGKTEFENQ